MVSLTSGDAFLANAAEYDDLFYKLVEAGDILHKFRDAYVPLLGGAGNAGPMEVLIQVSEHYWKLIEENRGKKGGALSPELVKEVIKSGYETLEIGGDTEGIVKEDGGVGEKWRESDERGVLKRIARMAVEDVGVVLEESIE